MNEASNTDINSISVSGDYDENNLEINIDPNIKILKLLKYIQNDIKTIKSDVSYFISRVDKMEKLIKSEKIK
jgi:hypothetical protein